MEEGYGEYFKVRRVKPGSTNLKTPNNRGLDRQSKSGHPLEDAIDLKQEDDGDLEGCTKLVAGSSASRTLKDPSHTRSRKVYQPRNPASGGRHSQLTHGVDPPYHYRASRNESEDLPDLDEFMGVRDKDNMQLRPISRPSYQGYDPGHLDDGDEYDPILERAAEEKREVQWEGRRQRAMSAMQPTSM